MRQLGLCFKFSWLTKVNFKEEVPSPIHKTLSLSLCRVSWAGGRLWKVFGFAHESQSRSSVSSSISLHVMKCHSNLVIGMSDSVFLRKAVDIQLDTVKPALSLMKSWNYSKGKCHMKAGTPLYTMIYYSGHTALDTTTPKRTHRCTSNKSDIYIYISIYGQTYIHTHIYI